MVTLGISGEQVVLQTTELGGFTRNGDPFESGSVLTARNGNRYRIVSVNGKWMPLIPSSE